MGESARRNWGVWAAVGPLALWALIRVFGLEWGFPLVPLMAYTPYAAVASLFALGLAAALQNWTASAVAAVAALCLVAAVLPRALGSAEAIPRVDVELRVLAANVHEGRADAADLVRLARRLGVDVLSVEELTHRFAHELQRAGIARSLPYSQQAIRVGTSGTGLYSRFPMRLLLTPLRTEHRFAMTEIRLPGGTMVRVGAVHTFPPKTPKKVGAWKADLASLPAAEPTGAPWVLEGDFNATLDQADFRDLLATGYRDAGEVTGRGLEPTWPAGSAWPPPVTIDHVLADGRIAIGGYAVEDLPGSDHCAVFARLGVPSGR